MNIHEYQAKALFKKENLAVANGYYCESAEEAELAFLRLKSKLCVIKAQVHAGGRGEAGGVKLVKSAKEAYDYTKKMLGSTLVTKQTGKDGKKVHGVYVEQGSDIKKEYYLSLLVDRVNAKIGVLFSTEGGMNIETVAENNPELLTHLSLDIDLGLLSFHKLLLKSKTNLSHNQLLKIFDIIDNLFDVFKKYDCSQIEINPLAELTNGKFVILDAKCEFDDNAIYRQFDLSTLMDIKQEHPKEVQALKYGLSYVGLDGNIGCLVNGAGLAMATMDIIKLHGGEPLNFLDVGGGANKQQVKNALSIILSESKLKGIFVNIFGGIMHCDIIASAIVDASKELGGVKVPLVVRLEGTNVELGKKILSDSSVKIIGADSMADGAKKVCELAGGY